MNKSDIIKFFNSMAPTWDGETIIDDDETKQILDFADIKENHAVLDIACGTGVLLPYYLKRNVKKVTGVDISPEMIRIAKEKFASEEKVRFICADTERLETNERYDRVMIYNAFPHFENPQNIIRKAAELLCESDRLTVAHNMGIEQLNAHHSKGASKVSVGMIDTDKMEELFSVLFTVDVKIQKENMYVVSGVKK